MTAGRIPRGLCRVAVVADFTCEILVNFLRAARKWRIEAGTVSLECVAVQGLRVNRHPHFAKIPKKLLRDGRLGSDYTGKATATERDGENRGRD